MLLAGCAAAAAPGGGDAPTTPAVETGAPAAPPATPPAGAPPAPAPPPPEALPPRLATGDRWYVAVRASAGGDPTAERHRRTALGDGRIREDVSWGRAFADLGRADGPVAQAFVLAVTGDGLVASPDGEGATGYTEVALPLKAGTTWEVTGPGGRRTRGRIEARERIETPGGAVDDALRVVHEALGGAGLRMTTWYDAGLRPVRAEVRRGDGSLVEARAALAGEAPTPEAARAAVAWAREHLSK